MIVLEVEANVYNLEMRFIKGIRHDRLTIERSPDYDKVVDVHGNLNDQAITATAKITVTTPAENTNEVIKEVNEYLRPYSRMLSFAQAHDVYFHGFRCYEIEGERRKLVDSSFSSIRVGKPSGPNNIYHLQEFLDIAIPILKDKTLIEKTSLDHALIAYTEGSNYPLTIELKQILFFMGLETLANAHQSNSPGTRPWLLDDSIWSRISTIVETTANQTISDKGSRDKFLNAFGNLKKPPIIDKLRTLCTAYDLPDYSNEIAAMSEMRNAFAHGRPTKKEYRGYELVRLTYATQRLLLKFILKLLNFYEGWPKVHHTYTQPDLFALD